MGAAHRRAVRRRGEPFAGRGIRDPARGPRRRRARAGTAVPVPRRRRPRLLRDAPRAGSGRRPPPLARTIRSCPTARRSRASWARTSPGCTACGRPQSALAFLGDPPADHARAADRRLPRRPRPALRRARRGLARARMGPRLVRAPRAGAAARRCLLHRDYRTGNYLVHEGRLAAVLDWEFAGWGDAREDLGLDARPLLAFRPPRPRGRAASGRRRTSSPATSMPAARPSRRTTRATGRRWRTCAGR